MTAVVFFALGAVGGWSAAMLWIIWMEDSVPATKWSIRRAQRRNRANLRKTRRQ